MLSVFREIMRSPALVAVLAASGMLFLAAVFLVAVDTNWFLRAPYEVPEAVAASNEIRSGDRLRVGFRIIRRRLCQMDLDRFVVAQETENVVHRQRVPGGATPVGDQWVVLDIAMPELPPGRYYYRTTITNNCSDGVHVTQTPAVKFTVLPPLDQSGRG